MSLGIETSREMVFVSKRTMLALEMERGQSWLAGSLGMKDGEGKFSSVGSGLANCPKAEQSRRKRSRWKFASIMVRLLGGF